MKKALLIDADGVTIQRLDYGLSRILEKAGLDRQLLKPFFTGPFLDCERGKSELKELLPGVLAEVGLKKNVEDILLKWFDYENAPNKELLDLIQKYRQQGLICCLTTDQEKNRMEYIANKMGFRDLFDKIYCSCDLGCLKSEPRFWIKVFEKLNSDFDNLRKEDVWAWDDSEKVIKVARDFGFNAELYKNLQLFKQTLENVSNLA